MRFGVCTDSANVSIVERLGYDFIELGIAELAPEQQDADFAPVRERILASGVRAEAFNKFIPKGIMLVGPDVDRPRAEAYIDVALARAAEIGGKVIVWGSPHARHVPDGFSRERAFEQLADIGRYMGKVAAQYDQTIVVEPLDAKTTNTVWTVKDGFDTARQIGHGSVKTMADIYQMYQNDEPLTGMEVAGDYLAHVHVSDPDRMPPSNPEYFEFYQEAFRILKAMGYSGRVSTEARFKSFAAEAEQALAVIRKLWGTAS
jgi:sugar phosphate isomerase/epimerase